MDLSCVFVYNKGKYPLLNSRMPFPEGTQRPADFEEKLEHMKMMRDAGLFSYQGAVMDLEKLAEGDDPDGIRKYYQGWTREDIRALLQQLDA